ncbi:hypothetical protein Tco_1093065 [Tanacetum coccineum]|uniref:Uncharacterized protein n=1 Tax=Tanacetum coccineum TaxID=301880 RepID=A0ABQ5IBL7_9ASTR
MCIWLDLSGQTSGPCQPMENFFIGLYYQLRSIEDKLNYLEQPLPPAPVAPTGQQVAPEILAAHTAWELKALFAQQAEQELLQTTRDFHACKQEEGISIERTVLSTIAEVAKERRKPLEQSMECEMQSIKDNEVWILVELPPNGSKRDVWVSCYTEAVYLTDSETSSLRRLEMCFVFYGGAVDWKSGQAKHFFATSSAEA